MTKRTKVTGIFLTVLLLFLALLFPGASRSGVEKGLDLVLGSALPALFPNLVLSRIITFLSSDGNGKKVLFLPLLLGTLCGFPIGAATAARLAETGCISKKEGEQFLFFCNNAGPAFLLNLCGLNLMGHIRWGWYLVFLQTLFTLLFFFLFFGKKLMKKETRALPSSAPYSFSELITQSFSQSAKSFAYISACILFFTFLSSLLTDILHLSPLGEALVSLFLELTGGVQALTSLPQKTAFSLCAAGIGWSGISVQLQTIGIIRNAKFSTKYFFAGKITFAVLLFVAAEFLQKCL